MDFTGQAISVFKDWSSGKFHITFSVNEEHIVTSGFDKIKSLDKLSIKVAKYRKKRSLDANAYAWVLMQEIADVTHTDKWSVYLEMLRSYGVFTHIVVKPQVVDRIKAEWRAVIELGEVSVGGQTGTQLQCYFGSSTYDTKEMSRFIDGIVREAEEHEIDTRTPDEIEIMKQKWGV